MRSIFTNKRNSNGFTIVELMVVIVVSGILGVLVFSAMGNLYTGTVTSLGRTNQDTDTVTTLHRIDDLLDTNVGFQATATAAAPLGYNNGADWNYMSGNNPNFRPLIVKTSATNAAIDNTNRSLVLSGTCSSSPTDYATVTQVYFVSSNDKNLYRRTIVSSSPVCNGPIWQKQTCAVGQTSAPCQGQDALLLRDVTKFSVDYYSDTAAQNLSVASTDTTRNDAAVNAAKMAKITVATSKNLQGKQNVSSSTIQVNAGSQATQFVDTNTSGGGSCVPSNRTISVSGTYAISACATFIDIVAIGGGGGGQGGSWLWANGYGGRGGEWNYVTLKRGVDYNVNGSTLRLSVAIGSGGAGGEAQTAPLRAATDGSAGGNTTVGFVSADVTTSWSGLTAAGGAGGNGFQLSQEVPGNPTLPPTLTYLGRSYDAGAPGTSPGASGRAPGGAGAGSCPRNGGCSTPTAGSGEKGGVWIRTY